MIKQSVSLVLVFSLFSAGIPARAAGSAPPVKKTESPEKKALEKLKLENSIYQEEKVKNAAAEVGELEGLRRKVGILTEKKKIENFGAEAEQQALSIEQSLYKLREQARLRATVSQRDELQLLNLLEAEKEKQALAAVQAEQKRIDLEERLKDAKQQELLGGMRRDLNEMKLKTEVERAQLQTWELQLKKEQTEIDMELKRLALQSQKMKLEEAQWQTQIAKLKAEIALRSSKEEWRKEANREPDYSATPFQNGRLTISDRRIPLNGPIWSGVADFVTERIHYFNNEDPKRPIFLVIDFSPGGSIMAGERILKAIEASEAPVHVVVKSFAASMAAIIVTMAKESYAYPNAIILHHEMSSVNWGNMTQLKEQLENAKEWERRMYGPLAKKMGLNLENFRKEMYRHNSDGDWEEFADNAQKLKWVKNIVLEIRETGFVKKPDDKQKKSKIRPFSFSEEEDEKGGKFVKLPRLNPSDMYFIHNPDNYYR